MFSWNRFGPRSVNVLEKLFGWLRGPTVNPPASSPPTFDRAIAVLQQFKKQKEAFVHPLEVNNVEIYLSGFRAGAAAFGVEIPKDLRRKVLEKRGYQRSAAGPVPQMKAKGMTEPAMMDELIDIEIELWQRLGEMRAAK